MLELANWLRWQQSTFMYRLPSGSSEVDTAFKDYPGIRYKDSITNITMQYELVTLSATNCACTIKIRSEGTFGYSGIAVFIDDEPQGWANTSGSAPFESWAQNVGAVIYATGNESEEYTIPAANYARQIYVAYGTTNRSYSSSSKVQWSIKRSITENIAVKFFNDEGAPMSDVSVTLKSGNTVLDSGSSNSSGTYKLDVSQLGYPSYTLLYSRSGYSDGSFVPTIYNDTAPANMNIITLVASTSAEWTNYTKDGFVFRKSPKIDHNGVTWEPITVDGYFPIVIAVEASSEYGYDGLVITDGELDTDSLNHRSLFTGGNVPSNVLGRVSGTQENYIQITEEKNTYRAYYIKNGSGSIRGDYGLYRVIASSAPTSTWMFKFTNTSGKTVETGYVIYEDGIPASDVRLYVDGTENVLSTADDVAIVGTSDSTYDSGGVSLSEPNREEVIIRNPRRNSWTDYGALEAPYRKSPTVDMLSYVSETFMFNPAVSGQTMTVTMKNESTYGAWYEIASCWNNVMLLVRGTDLPTDLLSLYNGEYFDDDMWSDFINSNINIIQWAFSGETKTVTLIESGTYRIIYTNSWYQPNNNYCLYRTSVSKVYAFNFTVLDEDDNPIKGAKIATNDSTVWGETDINGQYTYWSSNQTLTWVISAMGYVTKELPISSGSRVIYLREDRIDADDWYDKNGWITSPVIYDGERTVHEESIPFYWGGTASVEIKCDCEDRYDGGFLIFGTDADSIRAILDSSDTESYKAAYQCLCDWFTEGTDFICVTGKQTDTKLIIISDEQQLDIVAVYIKGESVIIGKDWFQYKITAYRDPAPIKYKDENQWKEAKAVYQKSGGVWTKLPATNWDYKAMFDGKLWVKPIS